MKNKIFASVILTVLTIGCNTTRISDPIISENNKTSIFGSINLNAQNFENYLYATVNGSHTHDIQLTFINVKNNTQMTITSGEPNGQFFVTNVEPGYYKLTKLYYKYQFAESWADVGHEFKSTPTFYFGKDTVYNFGNLQWECDKAKGQYKLVFDDEYDGLRLNFINAKNNLNWARTPWKKVIPERKEFVLIGMGRSVGPGLH